MRLIHTNDQLYSLLPNIIRAIEIRCLKTPAPTSAMQLAYAVSANSRIYKTRIVSLP